MDTSNYNEFAPKRAAAANSMRRLREHTLRREQLMVELYMALAKQLLDALMVSLRRLRPDSHYELRWLGRGEPDYFGERFPRPRSQPFFASNDWQARERFEKEQETDPWYEPQRPFHGSWVLMHKDSATMYRDTHFLVDANSEVLFVKRSGRCYQLPTNEEELFKLLAIPVIFPPQETHEEVQS